ncbi:PAS domain-containing sensor histidine kinase [Nocardioides aurantiacus]|uniref:PAS domain S-box-containing protein n=1 Tax=Nocardioides aurantiacus TaxID=86796 RepID=A0A3N2CTE8_9ACTN|nr:PAS domain-containing sensor histidine kinase [Nocardioides aurantiacus]ROR90812.1 PAS domain S-box-containing protein [Nocardioides aurantiacus]
MSVVRRPLAVRVLITGVVLVGVVFAVTTVPGVRSRPGFWVPVDGWLQGTAYVLMAALVVLRPLLVRRDRLLWGLVAAAMTARSIAFLLFFSVVRTQQPIPYPSVSDGFWITSALLLLVALASRARHGRALALSRLLLLDGLVGALAAAGLALAVVVPVLRAADAPGTPPAAVGVNLAYPLLDVVALVLVAALVAAGCRAERPDLVLLSGIVVSAAVDVTYLLMVNEGVWRPGTPVSALAYVGTALVCLAPWSSAAALQERPEPGAAEEPDQLTRSITAPGIAWTAALAVFSLVGLLVVGLVDDRPSAVAQVLLTSAVVVAMGRGLLTLREDQQETDTMLGSSALERQRFAALVEASDDFIAIAGLDGRLLYLNPAGRELTGISADADVRGMGYEAFRPDEELERTRSVAMPQLRSSGHFESRTWLRHQAGRPPVPVLSHSFVMRSPATGTAFALGSIQRDVTDMDQAEQRLQQLADERQELLTRLVEVQDDERARIAADVHDDSVQALAAVQLRLGLLERQLAELLDDDQRRSLETVQETVAGATGRLRHLLFDLESPARRTDLVTALEEAASYVLGEVGVGWTVDGHGATSLPEATRVTAYRVAKEALVNVRKHAEASHVHVEVRTDEHGVAVSVLDDGRGIAPGHDESRPGHLGLAGMRDRATVAGGDLEVGAGPEGGTRLRLWLPLPSTGEVLAQ